MQLYLCEKPSQAKDIANVLGVKQRGQGFLFSARIIVTWAIGHLLEVAAPEHYGEQFGPPWLMDVLPVLPVQWQWTVKKEAADQFAVIQQLLKRVDEVIIATDADREGEVIARELLEYCRFTGTVRRLWLSALDETSIRQALAAILPGEQTEALYQAGLGRVRADWLTGINLTRLYTLKAQALGFGEVLSIGRVQTPTLALVVNRDKAIDQFVPKPYWQVMAKLEKDNTHFQAKWLPAADDGDEENRCTREAVAQAVQQRCQQATKATVMDVSKKREKSPPPLCFDLGTLQQTASRLWGMGASQVLTIAQSLYETHKATTYPRTDCGYLPVSMQADIPVVLTALVRTDPAMADIISQLDEQLVSRVWNDKKITAHHAIIPTRHAFDLTRLTTDELKVYKLIRQHYLAQFLPAQETDVTEVTLDIGGQLFRAKGRVNVLTGWKVLFTEKLPEDQEKPETDSPLPRFHQGDRCQIIEASIQSLHTKPPAPFTEGTLIAAMKNAASLVSDPQLKQVLRESAGLGTEATRAGILDTLFKRQLIEHKKKAIQATPLARELIAGLPEVLTSPGMTALWEQSLDDIAQGKTSLAVFMQKQAQWLLHLVERGKAQPLHLTLPKTPNCPNCGSRMRQRQGKTSPFWSCVNYPGCKGMLNAKALTQSRKARRANQKV
ncbi:DNA topoisomerase III [Xenorhabdus bovienii]|nr:DNA topoisomerase III [Xenorhabdus bovienii]MDE1476857.1 DNA topoisomerase III [Xenorhabdus bovienii]MDE1486241.1 DNA topoisomerase III [Xenorhabdus bovienii]MDE1496569.1 DNA topoisomerase III [Xenorhabdus bovienii]MDE9472858.1 DNA topoisomerase III [Xenorhabdus bovienii]MDE9476980.1 DNA topoisomerase III [Xenorhabdus bovienii]